MKPTLIRFLRFLNQDRYQSTPLQSASSRATVIVQSLTYVEENGDVSDIHKRITGSNNARSVVSVESETVQVSAKGDSVSAGSNPNIFHFAKHGRPSESMFSVFSAPVNQLVSVS